MLPWITLRSPALTARVDPKGAQLSSLCNADGLEFLWQGDPAVWAGRAPILFPIVGTLHGGALRVGNQRFPMSRHGFARGSVFALINTSAEAALFRLGSSEASLAQYPFPFRLDIQYQLHDATLSTTATIHNEGAEPLPASFGFHPGFRWPLPGSPTNAEHFLEFEHDEPAPIRRLDAAGLLSPVRHPTPIAGRRLGLHGGLFREDAIILDAFSSRHVEYGAETGPRIELGFPEARYLGLWSKPGAPFICIEPWQGISDPAGFEGDCFAKPGIFVVEPGGVHSFGMTITLQA